MRICILNGFMLDTYKGEKLEDNWYETVVLKDKYGICHYMKNADKLTYNENKNTYIFLFNLADNDYVVKYDNGYITLQKIKKVQVKDKTPKNIIQESHQLKRSFELWESR